MTDIPLVTYSVELLEAIINKQVERIEQLEAALHQMNDAFTAAYNTAASARIEQLEAALRVIIENNDHGSYESTGQAINDARAALAPLEQDR